MNLEQIPKTFWHSLSVSVLIFTLGTVYVTYKSGNLTLKYKDFEFATAHATNEIEAAKKLLEEALATKEADLERLVVEKKSAEDALAMARDEIAKIKTSLTQKEAQVAVTEITKLEEEIEKQQTTAAAAFPEQTVRQTEALSKSQVRQVQERLDNIGAIQKTLRDVQFK